MIARASAASPEARTSVDDATDARCKERVNSEGRIDFTKDLVLRKRRRPTRMMATRSGDLDLRAIGNGAVEEDYGPGSDLECDIAATMQRWRSALLSAARSQLVFIDERPGLRPRPTRRGRCSAG